MASISLQHVSKTFANGQVAVRDVSLDIADGELLVLVGPSGSGKSTLLRMIAGLESPTSGRLRIGDRDVTDVAPQQRDLAMVFQNYALYPHKSVRDNLAFGLLARGASQTAIDQRVGDAAVSLGIADILDRKPAQLSGGQRQRVALGRAIVREPQAFLLDEPLSNLDPRLRVSARTELSLLQRRLAATMVYVTHDQEEAMTLGTRIAVMRDGRIEQIAPPLELFERPASAFVAQFIGSPAMNLWRCTVSDDGRRAAAVEGTLSFALEPVVAAVAGRQILVGARPHEMDLVPPGGGDIEGVVEIVEPLGTQTIVHVAAGTTELVRVATGGGSRLRVGDGVGLRMRPDRLHWFDAAGTRISHSGIARGTMA